MHAAIDNGVTFFDNAWDYHEGRSEEVMGKALDGRSDLYAAAIVLFEMLTGEKAFSGDLPVNVAFQHVHEDVPKVSSKVAGTPKVLDEIVSAAGARDPDLRPTDAAEFRSLLAGARSRLSDQQLDRRLGTAHAGTDGSGRSASTCPFITMRRPRVTSAMSPYLSLCIPDDRVAIHPPSVECVKLSGKCPSVQPVRV